jgi:hypothetical protein
MYIQAYVRHTYQDKVMDFFAAVSVEWWGAGQEHVRNYTLIIISKIIFLELMIKAVLELKFKE